MNGIDPMMFASVFANNLIIMYSGAFSAYVGFNRFFPLRQKPAYAFWAFFLLKCAIWAFYDAAFFFGPAGDILQLSQAIVVPVMSIVTYAILYITWDSALLKIGLIAALIDSVGGFGTVTALALSSWLLIGVPATDYVGYIGPQTFVVAIGQFALFLVLIRIISPIGVFIRDFKLKRERLWTIVLMALLTLIASSKTQGVGIGKYFAGVFAVLALAVLVLIPFIVWRGQEARRRRTLLARTRALTRIYDESLRDQAEFLTESRSLLDDLSNRIANAKQETGSSHLAEHLSYLQTTCDKLRFGTYSENPAFDVTLVSWKAHFDALDISIEYRIAPLADRGAQAALVVQALFEWVLQEYKLTKRRSKIISHNIDAKDGEIASKRDAQPEKPRSKRWVFSTNVHSKRTIQPKVAHPGTIYLRVFRRANQLFIEMRIADWGKLHFPREWVNERMPSGSCHVRDFADGSQKVVRVIVDEDAA